MENQGVERIDVLILELADIGRQLRELHRACGDDLPAEKQLQLHAARLRVAELSAQLEGFIS